MMCLAAEIKISSIIRKLKHPFKAPHCYEWGALVKCDLEIILSRYIIRVGMAKF
jgi:hypothetical protein